MALTDKLTAIGDAIRAKNGSTDEYTLDEMATAIENLSTGESKWVRPSEWPNLDILPLEEQVVYLTLDNTDRQALISFEVTTSSKKYNVSIGQINDSNEFEEIQTELVSVTSNWKPAYTYFNSINIDYPVIKIIPVDTDITYFALQTCNTPYGNSSTRHDSYVLESYICLSKAKTLSYVGSRISQHIKLINCISLTSLASAFTSARKLKCIEFQDCDTSKVTSFYGLCSGCSLLEDVSFLQILDFSSCTSVGQMFSSCMSLKEIDLTLINDTSKVSDWSNMFTTCRSLQKINMKNVDTSSATKFTAFIQNTDVLEELNMEGCDVSNVASSGSFSVNSRLGKFILPNNINFGFAINLLLSRNEVLYIFNQLPTITNSSSLSLGNSIRYITDDDKLIATNKGWTLN